MNNGNGKHKLGSYIPPIAMETSTRKPFVFRVLEPGDLAPFRVTGGVMSEETTEYGIVISSDGPLFIPASQMRAWLAEFDAKPVATDDASE